jgi:hypothetical protein
VLMLVFQLPWTGGFMAAFRGTFQFAALIPAAVVFLELRRGRWSRAVID